MCPALVLGRPADHNDRFEPHEAALRKIVRRLHGLGVPVDREVIATWAAIVEHWPRADSDDDSAAAA